MAKRQLGTTPSRTDDAAIKSYVDTGLSGKQDTSAKGQANGYASLDGGGKVPVSQLPNSIMEYQGTWNASTNTPTLADGTGSAGDVYRVSVAASRNLGSGSIDFQVGDYAIYNGSTWEKADTTDAVATVNGYTGNITLAKSDVGLGNVDNTSDATKNSATAALTNKDLTSTTNTFPSSLVVKDANSNVMVNALNSTVTTTTQSATALTLTAASAQNQIIAGGTGNQVVYLPSTGVTAGMKWKIYAGVNNSFGWNVQVYPASGGMLVQLGPRVVGTFTALVDNPTTSAHWFYQQEFDSNNIRNFNASGMTLSSPAVTGTASVASGGAISLFNTADQTTNFERGRLYWNSNVFTLAVDNSGTGTARQLTLTAGGGNINMSSAGTFVTRGSTTITTLLGVSANATGTSGTQVGISSNPTINQSGTAGYTALLINPTETATGSGTKRLIDAQVGGSSQFTVDNTGNVFVNGTLDLGNASDTTLSRSAAGELSVEGVPVVTTTGTQSLSNKTITSSTLTSPRVNQILDTSVGVTVAEFSAVDGANSTSYLQIRARSSGRVDFAALGTPTDISMRLQPKGTGNVQIFPSSGVSNLGVALTTADTDVSLNLTTKGAGTVQANGVPVVTTMGIQSLSNKTLTSPTLSGITTIETVSPQALNVSSVGYLGMPANSQSANYTLVAGDAGDMILHPSSDNVARTFTIPANSSVAYPTGTVVTFVNAVNTVTIAITSDTMTLAGTSTTGSRTLAANGVATAIKTGSTTWLISGVGLS